MIDFGEIERKRFIARERRKDLLNEGLWLFTWLVLYITLICGIIAMIS